MTILGWILIVFGVFFFLSGTLALLRFPDLSTKLHALTKADNLGLGFIIIGLSLHSGSFTITLKLLLIWLLISIASAGVAHLIASSALSTSHLKESKE